MKILVLANELPASTDMPGSPRTLNLCMELAKNHSLDLFSLTEQTNIAESYPSHPDVSASVKDTHIELRTALKESARGKLLHRFRQEAQFSTAYRYPEFFSKIRERLAGILSENSYDCVYASDLPVVQYLPDSFELPLIIDYCDCMSRLKRQEAKKQTSLWASLAFYRESLSVKRWERLTAAKATLGICISKEDLDAMQTVAPAGQFIEVGNGVDTDYFSFSERPANSPPKLIFTGVMDYTPNEDAALYFAKDVFPHVKAEFPESSFSIVGSSPTQAVKALSSTEGVEVSGRVPDIRPYLEQANIFVCPLRMGVGVKNKILTAMACGLPTIVTPMSLSGIKAKPGEHLLVAENPEDFCAAITEITDSDFDKNSLVHAARKLVEEHFSWSIKGEELLMAINRAVKKHGW